MTLSVNYTNGTFPNGFYLVAFHSFDNKNYFILALAIIYLITLLCNITLLTVIVMNSSLQNPKFLAVCNLAVVDISINSVIIPQMVPVFVFNLNQISFEACFTQMFFLHYFGDMESVSLALLAYDRLVAICFPLHYPTINTNLRMVLIIAGLWLLVFVIELYPVTLASSLSYCRSRIVQSCCCEHGQVYRLACGDISFNRNLATTKALAILLGPLIFIICSYVIVVVTVLQIASTTQCWKAFNTCITHMILVFIYYMPIILAYILGNLRIVRSIDVFTAILTVTSTLPAMLNPIIYSLKTEELQDKLLTLFKPRKVLPLSMKKC